MDAHKCHPGQEVKAKTTRDVKQGGRVVLHKGTRLVGHVTEAQARTKGNAESSVGIMFDEAVLQDGEHVPFHAAIQALAATPVATADTMEDGGMMDAGGMASGSAGGAARGGLLGGAGSAAGATTGGVGTLAGGIGRNATGELGAASSTAASAAGNVGGLNAAGQLTQSSSGVFGLQGLALQSAASNAAEGSVITSDSRNVHLSSGTQMLLRVVAK